MKTRITIKQIQTLVDCINYQGQHKVINYARVGDVYKEVSVDGEEHRFSTNKDLWHYLITLLD